MSKEIAADLIKRGNTLFDRREPFLNLWQELALNFYPQRADFNTPIPWGEEFSSHLYDDAPVVMRRDLANSVGAMLRPRGRAWFKPALYDEDRMDAGGVADWFDGMARVMWRWMYDPHAGFVRATKEVDHDFVTFGNGPMSVEVNKSMTGLRYRAHHLRDCVWTEDHFGNPDQMHRKIQMPARQIKQKWGHKGLHENIVKACEKEPDKEFEIRHVMMPLDDFAYINGAEGEERKLRRKRFNYASIYVDVVHGETISIEGSYEFRYVVARWQPLAGCPFAFSPATVDTLCTARMLQVMARTANEALEKSVDPPAKATQEAVIGDINLAAGGLTWIEKEYDEKLGSGLELFDVGKNALLALQAIDRVHAQLGKGTYISDLRLPEVQFKEMTAFETQKRIEEWVRGAMPLVEPWESQYSAPLLDETFQVLSRMGAFGEIPEPLQGQDFQWTFINPVQETAEALKSEVFARLVQMTGGAAVADGGAVVLDATIAEIVDFSEGYRDAARGIGVPEDWMRDKDEVAERVAAKAAEAQAQQALATVGAAGEAATRAGEGMSAVREAMSGTPA